jgi:nitroreductase
MEKPAPTIYPIDEILARRWSPVGFSSDPVEKWKLWRLLEAARWAPSCFNEQPWRFLVATNDQPEEFERMLSCLAAANQEWARHAPVLMVSVASTTFALNGKPNRHAMHDVGLATENLILQAMNLGLFAHPMAGFNATQVRELYSVPADCEPAAAIALGYYSGGNLSEALRQREQSARSRKPFESFVFSGSWGQPLPRP